MGTWNGKGINGIVKRKEVVDVFRKRRFELLASTETKIKENGQILWLCGVDGVNSGVQKNKWAMKGVAQ